MRSAPTGGRLTVAAREGGRAPSLVVGSRKPDAERAMGRIVDARASGRLDARCRAAVLAHRLDAFDNVDVAAFLGGPRLSIEDARWIGRHLMENGRALAAYRDGQAILAEVARAG